MARNKVIYGDDTLIDLTEDTVAPSTLLVGATAHDAAGNFIDGEVTVPTKISELENDAGYLSKIEASDVEPIIQSIFVDGIETPHIKATSTGCSWINAKNNFDNAIISDDQTPNSSSYYPFYTAKTMDDYTVSMGVHLNAFLLVGMNPERTEHGIDWSTSWDAESGNIRHSALISAKDFALSGGDYSIASVGSAINTINSNLTNRFRYNSTPVASSVAVNTLTANTFKNVASFTLKKGTHILIQALYVVSSAAYTAQMKVRNSVTVDTSYGIGDAVANAPAGTGYKPAYAPNIIEVNRDTTYYVFIRSSIVNAPISYVIYDFCTE